MNILKFFKYKKEESCKEGSMPAHRDVIAIRKTEQLESTVSYYKDLVSILNRKRRILREIQIEYEPIIDRQKKQVSILSKTIDDMSKNSPAGAYVEHVIRLNRNLENDFLKLNLSFIKQKNAKMFAIEICPGGNRTGFKDLNKSAHYWDTQTDDPEKEVLDKIQEIHKMDYQLIENVIVNWQPGNRYFIIVSEEDYKLFLGKEKEYFK